MSNSPVIIVPHYEDVASNFLFEDLQRQFGEDFYLLVVDDGSRELRAQGSWLEKLQISGRVLRLKKNVGHQCAIAVGIAYAVDNLEFSQLVIMDGDGEDRPEDVKVLLEGLEEEGVDVVVAERTSRHGTLKFKIFYLFYKIFFKLLVGVTINFGNFLALTHTGAKRLAGSADTQTHVAGSVLNSKLSLRRVPLARGKRYEGQSKMNLISLTLHGMRSVMIFTESVLVRITLFCAFFVFIIIVTLLIMVILKLAGLTIAGWFSTIGGILLLLLFQLAIMALLILLLAGRVKNQATEPFNYQLLIDEVISVQR